MTSRTYFLDDIRETVLFGDGAMGTALFSRGAELETGVERLNLTHPDMVRRLHADYIAAGSRFIETNTFSANRIALSRYGAGDECADINLAGARIAREAAGTTAYVAGSVGPLPHVEGDPLTREQQREEFALLVESLLEGGVDALIFETFVDLGQLTAAIETARSRTDLPVIAQMAFERHARTAGGDSAETFVRRARDAGADVVGANCGSGVSSVVEAVREMEPFGMPMSAFMNAGFAERVENRHMYLAPAEYLAERACELVRLGVHLIGGCCGTTPDTIAAMVDLYARRRGALAGTRPAERPVAEKAERKPPEEAGEVAPPPPGILVELDPPRNLDMSPLTDSAAVLRDAGIDAITLADNPLASVRVDVISAAGIIRAQSGIDVVPHLTGRDRNRIALQSSIMGAHALGIRSLLCVTGDPIRMYNETNTSGVFDVSSIGLVQLVSEFNEGRRLPNNEKTAFSIGVAVNPNARTLKGQVEKMRRKIDAGAHFALTQPIYEAERLLRLNEVLHEAGLVIPVFVGLMPLTSLKNADFLHYEVPGISIPEDIRETMARYQSAADQRAAGMEVLTALVEKVAPETHGFYFIAPRNRAEYVLPLVTAAKPLITRSGG